jgi:hypothetical protein
VDSGRRIARALRREGLDVGEKIRLFDAKILDVREKIGIFAA